MDALHADGSRLKIALPDVVSMQCRQPSLEGTGEIKLRRLVKEALRMRPSRIIVGEVRQEECLDLATSDSVIFKISTRGRRRRGHCGGDPGGVG